MKTNDSTIKLSDESMNSFEGREAIVHLIKPLKYGFRVVDTDRAYWMNSEDTFVFEIDSKEAWRFGEAYTGEAMQAIAVLMYAGKPDEVDCEKRGTKTIYRLWWD